MPWVSINQLKEKLSDGEKVEVTTRFLNGLGLKKEPKKTKVKQPKKLDFKRY